MNDLQYEMKLVAKQHVMVVYIVNEFRTFLDNLFGNVKYSPTSI